MKPPLNSEQKQMLIEDTTQLLDDIYSPNLKDGQMKYQIKGTWLEIMWRDNLTASDTRNPLNYKYRLLCAQDLTDYAEQYETLDSVRVDGRALVQRINVMLFEALRSISQDLNILNTEYEHIKKA